MFRRRSQNEVESPMDCASNIPVKVRTDLLVRNDQTKNKSRTDCILGKIFHAECNARTLLRRLLSQPSISGLAIRVQQR